MRWWRPSLAILLGGLTARAADMPFEEQVNTLFRAPMADQIALAPDGRHVAFTRVDGKILTVVIGDLDTPEQKPVTLTVDEARGVPNSKETPPPRLSYLKWATANRLVIAPFPKLSVVRSIVVDAPILAVDADGKNPVTLLDQADTTVVLADRSDPTSESGPVLRPVRTKSILPEILGFPAGDREHLFVNMPGFTVTNGDEDPGEMYETELWSLDLRTGKHTIFNTDIPGGRYSYDRQGHRRLQYQSTRNTIQREFLYRSLDRSNWGPLVNVIPKADQGRFRVTAENCYGERVFPLGFDYDPNVLYLASNVGRDTFGVIATNLKTGAQEPLNLESRHADLYASMTMYVPSPALVMDEFRQQLVGLRVRGARSSTLWKDEELAALQASVEARFPESSVDILEWAEDRSRFLLRISSGMDPGRCYVFDKAQNSLKEITRKAPWLTDKLLHETEFFEIEGKGGGYISGYLTLPRRPRLAVPPVVICFAPDFPARPHNTFDPEAHVLASMGFVVVRLNQRGMLGTGRSQLDALANGVDRMAMADLLTTVKWLASRHRVDPKRIATFGRGFGGYLAVRALQLLPDVFKCAVAIDAPFDPDDWLPDTPTTDPVRKARRLLLEKASPKDSKGVPKPRQLAITEDPAKITKPIFLVAQMGGDQTIGSQNQHLKSQLTSRGVEVELVDTDAGFSLGLPRSSATVYRRMEEFFNVNLYDFGVKVGPTKEVK